MIGFFAGILIGIAIAPFVVLPVAYVFHSREQKRVRERAALVDLLCRYDFASNSIKAHAR